MAQIVNHRVVFRKLAGTTTLSSFLLTAGTVSGYASETLAVPVDKQVAKAPANINFFFIIYTPFFALNSAFTSERGGVALSERRADEGC